QEVKVEKGVSVGKAQKRADYAFYINPEYRQPKFFCEAKKPNRSLKNADDYFQTIRYGWNANTPIAVLTDFEEFHVLDCRFKPNINQVLSNPNHKSYIYTDFTDPEKFKEIYYLFSRNDVANNSLEKYADSFAKIKGKQKTAFKSTIQAIDDDFLEYIDEVRETLAKAFKKNDAKLSSEELTEATQRTIDRIVFIRFLEDKLIEPEYYISEFGKKGNAWTEFISVCRKLDAKYNGIVFKKHFIDEQNFQGPEQSTFKKICDEMSYLNSPYDFNAIPIHILGSIYERFLGKVVNATAQRVKVEEKPEVRKAGGVYYTPKYIVDYIVENTVGKIIIDKTPTEISKLRFADIACGSGSFLIGVFETLLKYHTEYYQLHTEQAKKEGCINKDGQWILSIKQKQNILLNNIYGVDIDNQAVEVTQLSLALKMLEDESTATANEMQVLFHEKILPDLSKNIVCGNSLIGTDILQGKMFPTEEERKLNPMDFETTFPEVFRNGGFDAIVGNPPYVRIQTLNEYAVEQVKYFNNYYSNIVSDSYDLYLLFIYKGFEHLNSKGILGFITPHKFFTALMGKKLREYLMQNKSLERIIDFSTNQIFEGATTYTCLLFLGKSKNMTIEYKKFPLGSQYSDLYGKDFEIINIAKLNTSQWNFSNNQTSDILDKIASHSLIFENITSKMFKGSSTGNDEIFLLELLEEREESNLYFSKVLNANVEIENKLMKKFIYGEDIKRYYVSFQNIYLLYPYEIENGAYRLLEKSIIEKKYPKAYNYLSTNRTLLLNRKVDLTSSTFYKYSAARSLNEYQKSKIMIPDMLVSNRVSIDLVGDFFHGPAMHSIVFNENVADYKELYFLGVLNSKIFWYYISNTSTALRGNAYRLTPEYLKGFCFPHIDFNNETEKQTHDKIVSLVDQMLESKKQLQTSKTDKDKTYWERKCEQLDHAIDSEVYKLYALTPEEIKIVEGREV
ncbi:MAG: Eco57I restriction-modification methylase domain-containing protein, partial [Ignavibacteria bacterium]